MNDFPTIDPLIIRYLDGSISDDELLILENWVKETDEHKRYFCRIKNIWASGHELQLSETEALEKVRKKIAPSPRISKRFYWYRIAGILLLPVAIAAFWLYSSIHSRKIPCGTQMTEVSAAYGTVRDITLSDGSHVWLNAGSRLRYPSRFIINERIVELTGEAYFEVHSDPSTPFLVKSNHLTVKATGTKFNVRSVPASGFPSVTLIEGMVQVKSVPEGSKSAGTNELRPNQRLILDTLSGDVMISEEDTYRLIAWKDGKLIFRNDPLEDVVNRLNQQYNADIRIEGDNLKKMKYRATFTNESLDEILRLLKLSAPIDFRELQTDRNGNKPYIKRRIIIYCIK